MTRVDGDVADLVDLGQVVHALRTAGARFGYLFGSRAEGSARPGSDVDVAAWFGGDDPAPWEVSVPVAVDLLVLDRAPLHLAGRVAMRGRLLFEDDPPARVAWESQTRTVYLDELPYIEAMTREYLRAERHNG